MLLPNLVPVAATISSLAATASLIYVGIQTRQSVRNMRAQIHQGTAARTSNLLLGLMDAENAAAWIEGNGGTPSPAQIREEQFRYQCGLMMIAMEDYYSQHEEGLMSEEQFSRGCATFRERLKAPGLHAYWMKQREVMLKAAPRYGAFIDSLCTADTALAEKSVAA